MRKILSFLSTCVLLFVFIGEKIKRCFRKRFENVFLDVAWSGIGCFVCTSHDGDEPFCEDPFNTTNPNSTVDYYVPNCMAGRKERDGLFPASVCVKVKGTYWETGKTLVIRTCALDSNSLTMDTEIARIEHSCGMFDFVSDPDGHEHDHGQRPLNADRLQGCIEVCDSVDGCNKSNNNDVSFIIFSFMALIYLF